MPLQVRKRETLPRKTVRRLTLYLHFLEEMARQNVEIVSSAHMAKGCNVSSNLVRRDLSYFGEFGIRGIGYGVGDLTLLIKQWLGIDHAWRVALAGAGPLGQALVSEQALAGRGFHIVCAFDDEAKGTRINGLEVMGLDALPQVARECQADIGALAVRRDEAQHAANLLVQAGVKAIVSFTPTVISAPAHIVVEPFDLTIPFLTTSFDLLRESKPSAT